MSKKVFIGVGHGGADSGAVKYIVEKEYTLKTAFALSEILSKYVLILSFHVLRILIPQ